VPDRTTTGLVAVAAVVGVAAGIGAFTFVYAHGSAYLGSDPAACANCHVMHEQYGGWIASSHRAVATCNDCHAPHDVVGKWMTKAENGFRHSFAFTTGWFPEPIRITDRDRAITQGACRHCHADVVAMIDRAGHGPNALDCIACHRSVGHLH
jgi:cytochrome c nitrite reductase small subunit